MIVRDRQALFWALAFPLVFVFMFAFIGSFGDSTVTIGVVDRARDTISRQLVSSLDAINGFEVESWEDESDGRIAVQGGDIDYLLIVPEGLASLVRSGPPVPVTLVYEQGQHGGSVIVAVERFLDRMNLELAGASTRLVLNPDGVLSEELDFGEFVLPGIVLWGIMGNSVIGVAVVMANYRQRKILRRIKASPLKARTFFAALVSAYLALSLVQAAAILGIGSLVMGVSISGSLLMVGPLILVCNIVFLNIGFVVGAFSKSAAAASGLGNVIVLPLIMLSGIFFPADLLPDLVFGVTRFLPLTPMVETLRGITLGGEHLLDYTPELGLIALWIVVTSLASIRLFRFE